ncbi:MAG TPA: S8 family peptidase [Vicinamibacterales bacterium]|jgi:serine protease AprX
MKFSPSDRVFKKAVWGAKLTSSVFLLLFVAGLTSDASAAGRHVRDGAKKKNGVPGANPRNYKMDDEVSRRSSRNPLQTTSVIVTLVPGATVPAEFKRFARADKLDIINGVVLDVPNHLLKKLEAQPDIFQIHFNRPIAAHNYRTAITVGARVVQNTLGYTGAGVGVAVIDSGVTSWHDDLTKGNSYKTYPYGNQRVTKFVDFVNGRSLPYDDNGHGSHVAGTILGNGYDSNGDKAGIAPGAALVSLKVLDATGGGTISNIIAALNWVALNAKTYNIKVVNMSVGAGIYESYWTDPLTLAAKKVTDKGITIVAAAGNLGKNLLGAKQYGGITAPGNAPWVLTVGATSTMGTLTRSDDTMASFSSRGPTFIDYGAKPDVVAPGTGTVSLAVPGSTLYYTKAVDLLDGVLHLGSHPYLALSGTSMAAPVVSGTVALMLQANPNLTPNLIKAIIQYTAQPYRGYKPLEQGAGFLNTLGAVRLAAFYASNTRGTQMPVQTIWSQHVIWGNHMLSGGYLNPLANAWASNIVWGTAKTLGASGDNIVWGTACGDSCDNIVWGTADANGDNIVWGTAGGDDNIVWGTAGDGDNIVWGTASGDDNIVWGTDCGGADCDNIVWGTADMADNIVWGTADAGDNIVWGTSAGDDNIVWGTSADTDFTWGSSGDDATLFPDATSSDVLPSVDLEFGDLVPVVPVVVTTTLLTGAF